MYSYILFLYIIQPLLEYIIHRNIHRYKNYDLFQIHKKHHMAIHNNNYNNSLLINCFSSIITFPICFYTWGDYIWLGFFKYQLGHLTLHYYPFLFSQLSQFHAIHHRNPKVNYTLTAMWPDKIFGTYLKN
jgi:sterol desaturase/sphingolipid hydroxylase (fatty acid hydroxylase superfamily)